MRKLKVLLITLLAACLSLTLFACRKKDDGKTLNRLSGTDIEITDSVDRAAFEKQMETYKLTGRNEDGNIDVLGKDCEIIGIDEIPFGTPDRCTVTFKPKDHNENNVTAEVNVVIDHTWGTADADGKQVCSKDGATKITKDEDVAIHYGNFHYGTGVGPKGPVTDAATAIPGTLLTEEEAQAIGLHAESNPDNLIFNTGAGINEGKTSSGRIKAFGADESAAGRISNNTVPTLTAGDLIPGMSITIEGYAKQNAGPSMDDKGGPWNVVNGNWNAPSYGIADPYGKTGEQYGYQGGNAVIVRSEGWVLYNGIGDENSNNLLGGLPAAITGGKATSGGSTEASNCASRKGDTADLLEGQDVNNRPAYTSSDWKDWWVYSEGKDRHSLDSYQSFTHVRVTWTYRTYGEGDNKIGIITIDSDYLDEKTTLRSYIKVPTAERNAYRTIIHGDYSTLLITSSAVVETETVTDMRIEKVKDDATTEYLAGEQIDAGSVFNMQVKTEQDTNWHNTGIALSNDMLYYYNEAAGTYEDATTNLKVAEKWTKVGNSALTPDMKYFKVVLERTDNTFHALVPEAESDKIKITPNNVAAAYGDIYEDTAFAGQDPMATYTRTLGKGEADARYTDLTITKALFRKIGSTPAFSGLTEQTDYRYTVIRLVGIKTAGGSGFATTSSANNSDSGTNYSWVAKPDGNDVLLAVAIKKAALGSPITIEGVQTTPIRITFGTGSLGFDMSSAATYTKLAMNVGGEVKVTYEGQTFTDTDRFAVMIGSQSRGTALVRNIKGTDNANLAQSNATDGALVAPVDVGTSGVQVTKYKASGTTTEVTFKFPAYDFVNWTEMPHIAAMSQESVVYAEDYVEYGFDFTDGTTNYCEAITGGEVYVYEQGGTLYFVTAKAAAKGTKVAFTNVKGGFTVNINNGAPADPEKAKAYSFNLGYKESNGSLAFTDSTVAANEGLGLRTVVLSKAYGDYGYYVVASVAISSLGIEGDFGFQIAEATTKTNYWTYDADGEGNKLASASTGTTTQVVLEEGDCLTPGIVAEAVKSGDNVVFYAGYKTVGGEHHKGTGNFCDLCGASLTDIALTTNLNTPTYTLTEGGAVDVTGTYANTVSTSASGWGNYGLVIDILNGSARYHLATDGVLRGFTKGEYWKDEIFPRTENDPNASEKLGTTLPYNTLNGVVVTDGSKVDTESVANYASFLKGKSFRAIVTYADGTITITTSYYFADGSLALTYSAYIYDLTGEARVVIASEPAENMKENVDIWQTPANKSVIDTVANAAVGSHAAPTTVTLTKGGFDDDGHAVITATGMAAVDRSTSTTYLAFEITFSKALPEGTVAKVIKASDKSEISGAWATLAEGKFQVYVPVTADTGSFLIDLENYVGATLQSDIFVDTSDLGISNITVQVSDNKDTALTIDDATFTITYGGDNFSNVTKMEINGVEKALTAITTSDTEFGGLKVKKDSTGKVFTFTKNASDLSAAITGYTINLFDANGKLLANTMIAPAIGIPEGSNQFETNSGWYVKADSKGLYLFTAGSNPSSLLVNINAGKDTASDKLGMLGTYDLAFHSVEGAIVFKTASQLSKLAKGIYSGNDDRHLYVLYFDSAALTALGVAGKTYGVQLTTKADLSLATNNYYTVAATSNNITAASLSSEQTVTVVTGSCSTGTAGVTAKGDNTSKDQCSFYLSVQVLPSGHTLTLIEGGHGAYECSVCNAVLYAPSQNTGFQITAATLGVSDGDTLYNSGLSINFFLEQVGNDWDGIAVWTAFGKLKIALPNIQANNKGTDVSSDTTIKGLRDKLGDTNLVPGESATASNNATWDTYSAHGANTYVTVTISKTNGITFYKNGEKQWQYLANTTFGSGKVEDFVHAFLLAATKEGGIVVAVPETAYGGSISVNSILVEKKAYTDEEATARYNNYLREAGTYPVHEHSYNKGEDKASSGTTFCACGALNPQHTHSYDTNYLCKFCGMADVTTLKSKATSAQDNATGKFGQATDDKWYADPSTDITLTNNFIVKFEFNCGTCNGNSGVFELFVTDATDWNDGFLDYNPNDGNVWGGIVNAKQDASKTATKNPATYTTREFGTKPAAASDVTYCVIAYRINATFVLSYQITKGSGTPYTFVLTSANFPTAELKARINGYTKGMTGLTVYTGTITANSVSD